MRTTRSGQSALLLLDVVDVLLAQKVAYAIVGALAASIHGAVRASMDADAILSLGMQQVAGLEKAFKSAGFATVLTRGDLEDPIAGMLRLSDSYKNQVDLLIGLRGMDSKAFERAVEVPFKGTTLKFVGREDFIAMKVFAGGPLDLVDASRAIAAAGASLDVALLRSLAGKFGRDASAALERLLAQ